MKNDENWRLVLGMPILLELFTIIVLLFIIKHESINQLLQTEEVSSDLL